MKAKNLLFAVLTMMLWGTAPLFSKIGLQNIPPFSAMLMRNMILICLAVGSFTFSKNFRNIILTEPKHSFLLMISGAISGLVGQYTYYIALADGQTSQVVPIASSFPLMTALLAFVFFAEPLTLRKTLGIGLIVGGIGLISL